MHGGARKLEPTTNTRFKLNQLELIALSIRSRFFVRIIKFWNNLADHMTYQVGTSVNSFKNTLKNIA